MSDFEMKETPENVEKKRPYNLREKKEKKCSLPVADTPGISG